MDKIDHRPEQKFQLHKNMIYSLSAAHGGKEISCGQGVLWLTRAGDSQDYVLMPGERFILNQGGKIVIQAMAESLVQITSAQRNN